MQLRLDGFGDAEAWRRLLVMTPRWERRIARTLVSGARGQDPLTLSVPIEGGASVVKRGHPEEWCVSMHGRWPAVHIGALSAAYSATTFYPHLMPEIRREIEATKEGRPFGHLTGALHRAVSGWLRVDELLPGLRRFINEEPQRLRTLCDEKSRGLHTDLSFLDVIFRKGPEAIFVLMPLNK